MEKRNHMGKEERNHDTDTDQGYSNSSRKCVKNKVKIYTKNVPKCTTVFVLFFKSEKNTEALIHLAMFEHVRWKTKEEFEEEVRFITTSLISLIKTKER